MLFVRNMTFNKTMDLCLSFTNGLLSNGLLLRILIASITVWLSIGCMNMRVSKLVSSTPRQSWSVSRAAVASGRADGKHVPPWLRET